MTERLQKIMSNCGVASRRASEEMIAAGRVRVNGVIVKTPGVKVDLQKDIIVDWKSRLSNIIFLISPKGF